MPADWDAVSRAFADALDCEGTEREAFLAALHAEDSERAAEVERLLAADAEPHALMDASGGGDALRDGLREDARRASGDLTPEAEADAIRVRVAPALAGRFEIVDVLGRGGMAVVFSAHESKHDRRVALKVMRPAVVGRVDRRRFGVEVRLTAQLTHPHIVPLYDSGEADGLPYYVTAEIPGETLAARIQRDGAVPPPEAVEILRGVASALDYAHARRILHRDVKPANVLLHASGETASAPLALLADFGIGKVLAPEAGGASGDGLTRVGAMLGTLRYMSPEQLRREAVDHRADLYALGLVAYEMLTGRPAVEGATAYAVAQSHQAGPPPAPSTFGLPRGVDTVMTRALRLSPEARYESASALVDALARALGGEAPPLAPEATPAVAVLPLAARDDDAYLGDGIAEEVIHRLGAVPDLRVVARASSFAARDAGGPEAIGAMLGVRHVMSGSVRREGSRLRVSAELIDAATNAVLWSDRYDREFTDVFDVQDEIADAIAGVLAAHLAPARGAAPVPDSDAYDLYLRARHDIFQFTEDSLRDALDELARARTILPDNVALLSAEGYAHWQLVNAGIDPDPAHLERTLDLAEQIEAAAPGSHHAERLRGLAAIHQGRALDAIAHLSATLDADPSDVDAAVWLALLIGFRGQPHRAEPHVAMLVATDPLNPLHQLLPGFLALMRGHASGAPEAFRAALAMAPDNPVIRLGCGQAEAMAGETAAALATLQPLAHAEPGLLFAGLARSLARGLAGVASGGGPLAPLTDAEREAAATDIQWCWTAAQGAALAGDAPEATAWMRRAMDLGFANYPLAALYDPLLRPVRDAPEFEAFLSELAPVWTALMPSGDGGRDQ